MKGLPDRLFKKHKMEEKRMITEAGKIIIMQAAFLDCNKKKYKSKIFLFFFFLFSNSFLFFFPPPSSLSPLNFVLLFISFLSFPPLFSVRSSFFFYSYILFLIFLFTLKDLHIFSSENRYKRWKRATTEDHTFDTDNEYKQKVDWDSLLRKRGLNVWNALKNDTNAATR